MIARGREGRSGVVGRARKTAAMLDGPRRRAAEAAASLTNRAFRSADSTGLRPESAGRPAFGMALLTETTRRRALRAGLSTESPTRFTGPALFAAKRSPTFSGTRRLSAKGAAGLFGPSFTTAVRRTGAPRGRLGLRLQLLRRSELLLLLLLNLRPRLNLLLRPDLYLGSRLLNRRGLTFLAWRAIRRRAHRRQPDQNKRAQSRGLFHQSRSPTFPGQRRELLSAAQVNQRKLTVGRKNWSVKLNWLLLPGKLGAAGVVRGGLMGINLMGGGTRLGTGREDVAAGVVVRRGAFAECRARRVLIARSGST
jgi:hypothetical protein